HRGIEWCRVRRGSRDRAGLRYSHHGRNCAYRFSRGETGHLPGKRRHLPASPAGRSSEGLRAALHRRTGRCTRGASYWPHQPPSAGGHALSAAVALAEILASRPALALSLIRAGVRDSLDQTTQEAITRTLADSHRVSTGADIEEGIDAFFAKRAPVFTAGRSGTLEYKRNETEAGAISPRSDKDDKL